MKKKAIKNPLKKVVNAVLKRTFDILFSGFILVFFLSWMFPLFALIIKIQSKGPVIYKQLREGKDGVHFMCFKFRTMHLNGESDYSWTKVNDPRVTRFGVFLRRTSLDEFPQFLNVFLGTMSIVGPRPHMTDHTKYYSKEVNNFMLRHKCLPGITGWAQVNGRNTILWVKKFEYDVWYVEHCSFALDVKILFLTVKKVFVREGISQEGQATMEVFKGSK